MSKLKWTDKTPEKGGWYWVDLEGVVVIVEIGKRPGHDYLALENIFSKGKREFMAVSRILKAKWAGPIEEPAEIESYIPQSDTSETKLLRH